MDKSYFKVKFNCLWVIIIFSAQFAFSTILGIDNRKALVSKNLPWSAIGILHAMNKDLTVTYHGCTATLIAYDLVLTAAHCKNNKDPNSRLVFEPNRGVPHDGIKRFYEATILISGESDLKSYDWMLLKVDPEVGKNFGFVSMMPINFSKLLPATNVSGINYWAKAHPSKDFTLAGYSGQFKEGQVLAVHEHCPLYSYSEETIFGDVISHRCDLTNGQSGGPLLFKQNNTYYVVGITILNVIQGLFHREDWERDSLPIGNVSMNGSLSVRTILEKLNKQGIRLNYTPVN